MMLMTSTVSSQNMNQKALKSLDSQNGEISENVEHEIFLQGIELTTIDSGAGFTGIPADLETTYEAIDRAKDHDTTATEILSTETTTATPNGERGIACENFFSTQPFSIVINYF